MERTGADGTLVQKSVRFDSADLSDGLVAPLQVLGDGGFSVLARVVR